MVVVGAFRWMSVANLVVVCFFFSRGAFTQDLLFGALRSPRSTNMKLKLHRRLLKRRRFAPRHRVLQQHLPRASWSKKFANAAEIIKKREAAQTAHDAATAASSTQSESLEGVIVACGEALTLLETAKSGSHNSWTGSAKLGGVAVLAGSKVESSARATIEAFCQIPSRQPFLANGTAVEHERAYGHKGQTVIDLIKDLKSKFTEDLAVLQREMQNSQNAHDVLSVHLDNELLESQKMQGILSAKRTRESGIEIQAKEEAQEASTYLGENQDALRDVTQTCASKTEEWAQHEATRTGETKAILQAIDVLAQSAHIKVTTATATDGTNSADTGASSTDVSLPTTITPTSFLQFPTQVGQKILNLLNQAGLNLHAHKLQRLVAELTQHSSTGHLDSVIEHMKIIIFDLNSEQLQEDKVFQNIEAEWKKWTMKHSEVCVCVKLAQSELAFRDKFCDVSGPYLRDGHCLQ